MTPNQARKLAWGAGLVATGVLAGAIAAAAIPAGAQTPTPSTSSGATTDAPGTTDNDAGKAPGGQRAGEVLLTGTNADKAKAAALKAVPGATIERLETDADGAVYEAHLTKADGTHATVKFDKSFNVTGVEAGHGGGRGHDGPSSGTSSSSTTGTA
jgi:hypothetical protein